MSKLSEKRIIQILNNWQDLCLDSVKDYNTLDEAINGILELYKQYYIVSHFTQSQLDQANAQLIEERKKNEQLEESRKNGTLSDGFHTYNDLYYQRCILFATICNMNNKISWKSKKHSDGKKCFDSDEWFVVGIDTPEGSYTYHYEMKYWDLFKVQELEKGKEWDGHTEKDVTRLFSLKSNSISKNKIRNKIKKLEEEKELYFEKQVIQGIIDLLKELLEE